MPVNMAAVSGTLFEAEFFGHTRGAFTGAEKERVGYLKHANHGTLFLDEIGNLPPEMQGKLLRVLQDGEYTPVGSSVAQKVDVRVVAATNEDLEGLITAGRFRKDLYYRIKGGWLNLPPLRERPEDTSLLADRFLEEFSPTGRRCRIDEEALNLFQKYPFPGNIRELRSIIQSAVNLAQGKVITAALLPAALRDHQKPHPAAAPDHDRWADQSLAEMEKMHILQMYQRLQQNKSRTARRLGIGLNTLRRKLAAYGVG
jgi:transcriptional regulator with PAS, ATPase and Fis domain